MKLLCFAIASIAVSSAALGQNTPEHNAQIFKQCTEIQRDSGLTGQARTDELKACVLRKNPQAFDKSSSPPNPINMLMADGTNARMSVMLGRMSMADAAKLQESKDELRQASEAIDKDVELAVKAARGKQELAKAIKDYYAAATTYISAGIPSNRIQQATSDRYENEMEAKSKSLSLEMKIAGIK